MKNFLKQLKVVPAQGDTTQTHKCNSRMNKADSTAAQGKLGGES